MALSTIRSIGRSFKFTSFLIRCKFTLMIPRISSQHSLYQPLDQVLDNIEDKPALGQPLTQLDGFLELPNIIFGAGSFSNQYNTDDHLASTAPLRAVRLALRYGIRAFDTSAYYGPSEILLGNTLKTLESEFPRSSYQLMTKCGRYGPSSFDYTPVTIRCSVKRSLERLKTDYLDIVYLHDVEFVCTAFAPKTAGNHSSALNDERAEYGLNEGSEGTIRGEGDQNILDAFSELRKMKEEGLIKCIGITGYPLPTLLRLALLILHNPPYKPVDIILSYSHLTLQNATFSAFTPHFRERAQVGQLLAASPLSMGLLTPSPPPWHPAPAKLLAAASEAGKGWAGDLPNLALGYAIRNTGKGIPLVAGFSNIREVHECVKVWREVQDGINEEERMKCEAEAQETFQKAGFLDWSWASP